MVPKITAKNEMRWTMYVHCLARIVKTKTIYQWILDLDTFIWEATTTASLYLNKNNAYCGSRLMRSRMYARYLIIYLSHGGRDETRRHESGRAVASPARCDVLLHPPGRHATTLHTDIHAPARYINTYDIHKHYSITIDSVNFNSIHWRGL